MKVLAVFLLSLGCVIAFSTMSDAVREADLALYLSFDQAKGDTAKDKSGIRMMGYSTKQSA